MSFILDQGLDDERLRDVAASDPSTSTAPSDADDPAALRVALARSEQKRRDLALELHTAIDHCGAAYWEAGHATRVRLFYGIEPKAVT